MIVLDTNVVSALMQHSPDEAVAAWLDRHPADSVWITSITVFEIRFGIEVLTRGKKRSRLEAAFALLLSDDLDNRVVPLDQSAADAAARISAVRRAAGRPVDLRDTLIAGIVLSRRADLATRNVRHFDDTGLTIIDPWTAAPAA